MARRMLVKCTKCLIYSEIPRGSYVKHLVSRMECSGRCNGSFWQVWQVLVGSCVLHVHFCNQAGSIICCNASHKPLKLIFT